MEQIYQEGKLTFVTMAGSGEGVSISSGVPNPQMIGRKAIVFIKVHPNVAITEENVARELAFIEIFKNPLECLSIVAQVFSL